jgi:hypothetical protein
LIRFDLLVISVDLLFVLADLLMVGLDLLIVFPDLLMIGPNLLLVVTCPFCGYSVTEIARFRGGSVRGITPIILEFRLRVRARRVLMAYLLRRWRGVLLFCRCELLSVWLLLDTANAAIEADIDIDRGTNGNRCVVHA